ncbi:hypothetical protein BGCPKDLD_4667 [Methylorubrum suomiense]|uniref:Uncharacterized protein n=2 Tax=Methylorubrum suomiense TaxID=144191 RepID=A0ABQ4V0C7_9HYPH|nr:hypothetical protein BGCPKDLD_4667 [Methylorubrum suomiense]
MGAYAVRDLHVAATDRECVRHVLTKLAPGARRREYRDTRHTVLRDALAAHHRHQALVREFAL